jgi:WD40 repeat protein
MLITPFAQLQLPQGCGRCEVTPDGQRIVVASSDGKILVLDQNLITLFEYNIDYSIGDLTISPNGQMLAFTNEVGQLLVMQIDGKSIFEETAQNYQQMYCKACLFSADGTLLWNVVEIANNKIQIQYRETKRWQVLKRAVLPNKDPYSYFSLSCHPEKKVIAVWEAAGQDGSWVYWVWDDEEEIRVVEVPELDEKIPPEFHPAGGEFLIVDGLLCKLYRYRFPDCDLMGTAILEIEKDWFGSYMCYLSDNLAAAKSENNRLFLVDLVSMKVIDEVIFAGHEPRPLQEIYPNLVGDRGICGDLSYIMRAGQDRILSLHRNYQENRNTLLLWGGNLPFGKCSQPSSAAPYTAQLLKG